MVGEEKNRFNETRESRLRELERIYNEEFGTQVRFLVLEVIQK